MITVYTKNNCLQGEYTKKYLDEHGIKYTTINIEDDETARETVIQYGYKSVPVVVTNEREHWSGFQPDKLEKLVE